MVFSFIKKINQFKKNIYLKITVVRTVSLAVLAATRMSIVTIHRRERRRAVFIDILQSFGVRTIRNQEGILKINYSQSF